MRRRQSKDVLLSREGFLRLLSNISGLHSVFICIHCALWTENTVLITLNVIQIWCRCHRVNRREG